MKAAILVGVVVSVVAQDARIVPVHEEPRHRLVFDSPSVRVLDIQIPPGDTTLFHTHSTPILYVNISSSRMRNQNLNGEWNAPASAPGGATAGKPAAPGTPDAPDAPGAPGAPGAPSAPSAPSAPGAPDAPGAPSAPVMRVVPSTPPGRMMSTTSYAERPVTHRVNNIGDSLYRLIGIINPSAGNPGKEPSAGFDVAPELENAWFRGYRRLLDTQPTPEHRHGNPVIVVVASGSAMLRLADAQASRSLAEPGVFAVIEANQGHTLAASAADTQVVEVELRRPQ